MRIVSLTTDAFGGRGGIALYNRQFLRAMCSYPGVQEVVSLPRSVSYELESMPPNLCFEEHTAGGKLRYAASVMRLAAAPGGSALVVCGHLHLLPFARLLALRYRSPLLPIVYGIEAWQPTRRAVVNRLCHGLKRFVSIRRLTAKRLKQWAGIPESHDYYLPNCIDMTEYGVAPRRADLVERYGLLDRTVILTAGRLDSAQIERNKGFDEVIETMPLLLRDVPDAAYVVMGDGDDRPRLEAKARGLGLGDRVVFTGYVKEGEKADHYRLADVVAMPGSNPVFDRYPYRFAFLEPLACGVPVVGSRLEDPDERDDADAQSLVVQVDPNNPADIKAGIMRALARRSRTINPLLSKFDYPAFETNVHAITADILGHA